MTRSARTLLTALSRALFRNDLPVRAIEVADRALTIAERLDLEELIAEAFNNKGSGLSYIGRRRESVAITEAAVRTAQQGGFLAAELRARNNLSSSLSGDDLTRGLAEVEAGVELGERSGNRTMTTWLVGSLAFFRFSAAVEWDDALRRLQAIIDDSSEPADEHRARSIAVLFHIVRGEPVEEMLTHLDRLLASLADPFFQSVMDWLRGDLAFSLGAYREAYDAYLRAATKSTTITSFLMAQAARAASWQGDVARLRGAIERLDADPDVTLFAKASRLEAHAGLSALEGDIAVASNGFLDAIRSFTQLGAGLDQAHCALTFLHAVGPEVPEARAAADDARVIFESVGAKPYLERLDAELARSSTTVPTRTRTTASSPIGA